MSVVLDVNVLLRILLRDHPQQSPRSLAYVSDASGDGPDALEVLPVTLAELVWVLGGPRMGYRHQQIAAALRAVFELNVQYRDRRVMESALECYERDHRDWEDCLVAAYAMESGDGRVLSFDRGLDRIPGISRIEP